MAENRVRETNYPVIISVICGIAIIAVLIAYLAGYHNGEEHIIHCVNTLGFGDGC